MFQTVHKYIKVIFLIALGVYLIDQIILTGAEQKFQSLSIELQKFSLYFMYSFLISISNILVVRKLDELFPWQSAPQKRAIYGIVGALLVTIISFFMARVIHIMGFEGKNWSYFTSSESLLTYFFSILISLVIVLGFYTYYFFKEISKKAIKEHEVVAKTETAKFESLKSQIDPHFLFNSLNVLTSLIGENPKQAERFTTKLSQIYRYVLEQKDKDLVSLEEELGFAKIYMELLKMRFEEAVRFELPTQLSRTDYKIVPLSLQLLLENAVKHNRISEETPLWISIKEENGFLSISNNLQEKTTLSQGTGMGLKNISDRYGIVTHRKIDISKEKETFSVKLPLLTQKSNTMDTNQTDKETRYIKARERVDKIKEFYHNLTSYVIIIPLLIFINYKTYWGFKWFWFPMIGWGIGILFHFMDAYGYHFFLGKNWEERKIKEFMNDHDKEKWV